MFPAHTKKLISVLVSTGLVLQLTACGTLLHPERKGQTGGRIDPAIAIMDGIGLLFFVIPGLAAFAVDFYTGAIYLPGGRRAQLTDEELQRVAPEGKLDKAALGDLLEDKGVIDAPIQAQQLEISTLDSLDHAYARLALFDQGYAHTATNHSHQ